ncbi:MAG: hypothetical protein EA348_03030 [Pseudomonadaceae bacterium]|nr:MAG: hypothetical protein EA348_03030 [Pseudomonadaceae bacterium]
MPQHKRTLPMLANAVAAGLFVTLSAHASLQPVPDAEGLEVIVPAQVSQEGEALLYQSHVRLSDYAAAQHAVSSVGRIMRSSEMGHSDYADQLPERAMQRQGEIWLQLQNEAIHFVDSGAYSSMRVSDGQWQANEPLALADLAKATFTYQMHHSGGRWADYDLDDAITYTPVGYLGNLMRQLLEQHYQDAYFVDTDGNKNLASLAQGLDALHGLIYAWVRWHKPGGSDDMGRLSEERMEQRLGISQAELLELGRSLTATLDQHWSDDLSAYAEEGRADYSLADFGSLMRGHKGLYELLYIFGDEDDQASAKALFERKATMLSGLMNSGEVVQDWGVATSFSFTPDGVIATSDVIDTASQWRFLNHLTGGFGTLRENEGTSGFVNDQPELKALIADFSDQLLRGAQDYQSDADGLVVRQLALADGKITDSSHSTASIGWYLTAAGYAYRSGDAFDRPDAWKDDSALAERSRALYDHILLQNAWLVRHF